MDAHTRPKFSARRIEAGSAAVAAFVLLMVGLFQWGGPSDHRLVTPAPPATNQPAVLGQSVASATLSLSLTDVRIAPASTTAPLKRVTINVSLTNVSTQTQQISPGLQMFVVDQMGRRASATARYLGAGQTIGGPLAPQATRTQDIDFELDASSTPARFVFEQAGDTPALEVKL